VDHADEDEGTDEPVALGAALDTLAGFLQRQPLTAAIAALEHGLLGADAPACGWQWGTRGGFTGAT
jgi:hypothetical protein